MSLEKLLVIRSDININCISTYHLKGEILIKLKLSNI